MKKRILPILLALVMVLSLMPTIALADDPVYEVKLPNEEVEYVDEDGTGYFYVGTSLEVYKDGVKLEGASIFDDDPYEITSLTYSVKYKAQGSDGAYTDVPTAIITYGYKNSYFTINFSASSVDVFTPGVIYEWKVEGTAEGKYIPNGTTEDTFSCNFEGILPFCVVPDVNTLTLTTTETSITIDYNDVGLKFYYIPISAKNQDNIELAAVCGAACTASSGKTIIPQIVAYENGYAIQISPSYVNLFEDDTLTFTASYGNVKSNEITIAVKVLNPQAGALAKIDDVYYSDIHEVIEAAINSEDTDVTVKFLRGFTFFNNEYVIDGKNITFEGDVVLDAETAEGEYKIAFDIKNGGSLTLDGITLSINGTNNPSSDKKNDGTAINIGTDSALNLVNGAALVLEDLERGITVGGGSSAVFSVENSSVYVDGIDGNLTNGGTLSFIDSDIIVKNVGSYGLSASNLKISGGTASFNNVGYSALLNQGGKFEIVDGAQVNITGCGNALPLVSQYSNTTQVIDVSLKATGASFLVGENSSVTLTNNKDKDGKDVNSINVGDGTLTVDGSYNGNVTYDTTASCAVNVEGYPVQIVNKGDTTYLPAAITKPGYIFMGWKCSDGHTYQAGEVIEVTKNMTFTAIWANMPDITPGTPGGDDEPVVPDFPFTDVREGQWFYEAVKYVYDEGIMNGMDRYTFDPNGSLTRAMVWTMLARHEGVDTEGGATWYAKAQEWAVEAGVSDGTDPMGNITREQLVTMLWRLNGSEAVTGSLTGFTDYDKVSDWAGNAMLWATVNGIIEGDEANALNPTAGCTRAQAAAMIMRFCAYHEADSFGTVV